jgi:hypothetical protein
MPGAAEGLRTRQGARSQADEEAHALGIPHNELPA